MNKNILVVIHERSTNIQKTKKSRLKRTVPKISEREKKPPNSFY